MRPVEPDNIPDEELRDPARRQRGRDLDAKLREMRLPRPVHATFDALSALFLCVAVVYSLWLGGQFQQAGSPYKLALDGLSGVVGLSAREIQIDGLKNVQSRHVLEAISVHEGSSLIGFDAVAARRQLADLDWVVEATVQRLFPNRLHVTVKERRPYAIWQENKRFHVIDDSGQVMSKLDPKKWSHLPVVAGEGAQQAAAELINQLEAHSSLRLPVRAAARVADRRWTLYLANGIKVLLPARDVPGALQRLAELENGQGILGRDIASIDLRLEDRIALRLSERAARDRREAAGKS
ncbi:MAG: cell division protein FtsQ/DivIB [Pseudomonadota bacterium]